LIDAFLPDYRSRDSSVQSRFILVVDKVPFENLDVTLLDGVLPEKITEFDKGNVSILGPRRRSCKYSLHIHVCSLPSHDSIAL